MNRYILRERVSEYRDFYYDSFEELVEDILNLQKKFKEDCDYDTIIYSDVEDYMSFNRELCILGIKRI